MPTPEPSPSPSAEPEPSPSSEPTSEPEPTPDPEPMPSEEPSEEQPPSTTIDEAIARFNSARSELEFAPVELSDDAGVFLEAVHGLTDEEKAPKIAAFELDHALTPVPLSYFEQEGSAPVPAPELLDSYFASLLEPPLSEDAGWKDAMKAATAVGWFSKEEADTEDPTTQSSGFSLFGKPTPAFSEAPQLNGLSQVGQTVTLEHSGYTAGATLSLQWFRGSVPIDGAINPGYTLQPEDLGQEISVRATLSREGWIDGVSVHPLAEVVEPGGLVAPTVTISGTPEVGSTLTAVLGDPGPVPATITYEWRRGSTVIPGAAGASYVATAEDIGHRISVVVTASAPGYTPATSTSTPTEPVRGLLTAPVPVIKGAAVAGSKLVASPGAWAPEPVTLTYAWYANNAAIPGASSSTYVPSPDDAGKRLTVRVTGQKPGYVTRTRTSPETAAVLLPLVSPVPKITGAVIAGSKLTASVGTWGPSPVSLTYAWYANGVRLYGATSTSYVPSSAVVGKRITVQVTGSKTGYARAVKVSAATVPVAPVEEIPPTPTEAGSRSGWNSIARDMFNRMESDPDGQEEYASWTYAYQARMAAEYRGWQHPTTQQYLAKVYSLNKADGGYGLGKSWDAFGDGSVNPASTTYTVSTADHVGEVLLAGHLAGAVPREKLVEAVDSLLSTPIDDTPNGRCMAYSKSPSDRASKSGCVVNVSLGAAAFLSKVADSGVLDDDPTRLAQAYRVVSQLKWLGINTYNETLGGWAYLYLPSGKPPFGRLPVQDANHNAYTFESAVTLYGRKWLDDGMARWLAKPPAFPAYFDLTGRVRQQSLVPSVHAQNALKDAAFVSGNVTLRTQYAQLGMWSMRLAKNATLHSMQWRPTASISSIGIFNSKGTRLTTTVRKGSTVYLRSTVLSGTAVPVVNQTVKLSVNGSYSSRKTTGHQGNIAFAVTVTRNSCYSFTVSKEYTATKSPVAKTICFKVI
ncbi:hypothetical protein [Arthrobacter zhaoguopingii]|uniref:hypothetical protein n=1 Tax=Arthrobacter zhaoguopingii TaxID=2681491 RepID=UPI001358C881|nr:hypothetical protein [Arthrobacter zhaoguopingii]